MKRFVLSVCVCAFVDGNQPTDLCTVNNSYYSLALKLLTMTGWGQLLWPRKDFSLCTKQHEPTENICLWVKTMKWKIFFFFQSTDKSSIEQPVYINTETLSGPEEQPITGRSREAAWAAEGWMKLPEKRERILERRGEKWKSLSVKAAFQGSSRCCPET